MPVFAEDVDEDLDEADDEDIEDAFGEARRNRSRGRGYNKPRIEKAFATQAQLEAVSQRIGKDIRALDANVKSLERSTRRSRGDLNQSMQMMAMLPLLTKKSVQLTADTNGIPKDTKVLVDDGDLMTLMLPMMMLGGMSQPGATNGGSYAQASGGMDPMMMMMMVIAATGGFSKGKSA